MWLVGAPMGTTGGNGAECCGCCGCCCGVEPSGPTLRMMLLVAWSLVFVAAAADRLAALCNGPSGVGLLSRLVVEVFGAPPMVVKAEEGVADEAGLFWVWVWVWGWGVGVGGASMKDRTSSRACSTRSASATSASWLARSTDRLASTAAASTCVRACVRACVCVCVCEHVFNICA